MKSQIQLAREWITTVKGIDINDRIKRGLLGILAHVGETCGQGAQQYLYPNDTPANQAQLCATQSTCGLACESVLRDYGITDPSLSKPYAERIGTAVSNQRKIAEKWGAWVTADGSNVPNAGDMFQLDGIVHVGTVLGGMIPDGQAEGNLASVDGGQTIGTVQPQILIKNRRMIYEGNQLFLLDSGSRRKVTGWIDAQTLIDSQAEAGVLGP